jgi:hypothetical protein
VAEPDVTNQPQNDRSRRPILTLNGLRPAIGSMILHAGLDRSIRVSLVLASNIEPPDRGAKATIKVCGLTFPDLEVNHSEVLLDNRAGGLLELTDPVARADRCSL